VKRLLRYMHICSLSAECAFVLFQRSAHAVGEAAVALYAYCVLLFSLNGVHGQSVKRLLRYMLSLSAECTPSR
jgi:hypothetical protein